jgi:hypothetical protein
MKITERLVLCYEFLDVIVIIFASVVALVGRFVLRNQREDE